MNDIDEILEYCENGKQLPENKIVNLLFKLMEILIQENSLLELTSPINICGDIHGQLYDLFKLFEKSDLPNNNNKFIFLGDYVDRGNFSILTFCYLALLKIKFPNKIYFLRGNHESRQVNQMYGFYTEILTIYGHTGLFNLFNECFDYLPMAAIIDKNVFCVHGGISPSIQTIEKINFLNRFEDLPNEGPFCDLAWSDPEINEINWKKNSRGAGYSFGLNQVNEFLHYNNLNLITRSHQLVQEGFQYFFNQKLITIWSAPNYMYRYNNKATFMKYSKENKELIFFDSNPKNDLIEDIENINLNYFA